MSVLSFTPVRHLNPRAVYDQLLGHDALTRDQLAELTGLTRVAASASVELLIARGLALPVEAPSGHPRGPAGRCYALTPTAGYVVAADIRHRHVRLAAADLTGQVAATLELPFDEPDDVASMLHDAVTDCLALAGTEPDRLRRVVIGSPGVIDPRTGDFAFADLFPTWKHTLTADLRHRLGRPVVFENDVNLAAMAEARFGQGRDVAHLVFALMDHGLGLGLVLNGRLRRGRNGWAGEIGYLLAPMPDGCVEVPGLQRSLHQLASTPAIAALARTSGLGDDPVVAVQAASGNSAGRNSAGGSFLDEIARRVAIVVSHACLLVDPSVVVIDGPALVAGGEPLLERIRIAAAKISPTPARLAFAQVHDDPILRGALQTALDDARDTLFAD
jgi:predicted NBD/HSP70 family sugar kinase